MFRSAPEEDRVKAAIYSNTLQMAFDIDQLNEYELEKIARSTNCATIHVSGNCIGIACALLYNLLRGRAEMSVGNTFPVYKGLSISTTSILIFGRRLETLFTSDPKVSDPKEMFAKLRERVLTQFNTTGQRSFVITAEYSRWHPSGGHCLNIVVLGKKNEGRLVFVDAWRTKHCIFSNEQFENEYKNSPAIQVLHNPWPVPECELLPKLTTSPSPAK